MSAQEGGRPFTGATPELEDIRARSRGGVAEREILHLAIARYDSKLQVVILVGQSIKRLTDPGFFGHRCLRGESPAAGAIALGVGPRVPRVEFPRRNPRPAQPEPAHRDAFSRGVATWRNSSCSSRSSLPFRVSLVPRRSPSS